MLIKYAKGSDMEEEALPIECLYEFDEQTREIKINYVKQLSIGSPCLFIVYTNPLGAYPNNDELNKAINDFLGNKKTLKYKKSDKYAIDLEYVKGDLPVFNSEEEIIM